MWQPVADNNCYGIAIHNYNEAKEHRIPLTVGDTVHIKEEIEDWYRGYAIRNKTAVGIFPKCYIHLIEAERDQPPVVQEITSVLREWGSHWKNLYVTHNPDFEQIQKQIYELIKHRSKILSGTLPIDELKELKKIVTAQIDMGNKILGLDLVVRDEQGNLLNPDDTSTLQLYHHHKQATERIRKATSDNSPKPVKQVIQYSHIFFVSVRNFVCKMSEDAELLMTLYDAKEHKAITENYVVRWSKEGLAIDLDQLHNLRVLFTDLGSSDLLREKIYLVCYVIRVGAMETKEIDHRRSSVIPNVKRGQMGIRRPFGVAAMDVTHYMSGKLESDDEKQICCPFLHCDNKDNLNETLRKLIKEGNKYDKNNQGLWVSVKLLHGDIKQVREENPHLVLGNVAIARKMGFPEVILPGDVRNDLYLTLISGEFSKGNKTSDKNVEVIVTVCNENGTNIPGVISLGGGSEPVNEYRSVIYYHECSPSWHETFKVAVPIDEFKCSHLKFTFKHRSSNEAKDKNEKPFAMSYVKLMQENGTTLKDTDHKLLVYKIDYKKFDENSVDYFKLPSTDAECKDDHKVQVPGLVLSKKDAFMISSNVCSTKLTQNVDLLGLLNWVSHTDTLNDSLNSLMSVNGEEVVKFLQDVLDALFNILMHNPDSTTYDTMVFNCLLYVISLISDRKYQHFQPVLDLYIKESFSATLAYNKLIIVLKDLIDNACNMPVEINIDNNIYKNNVLYKAMKNLQYCIRFIARSRLLFSELYDGKDHDVFEANFKQLLQSIVNMMCYTTDYTLIVQGACLKYFPNTISDILMVYDAKKLSLHLAELLVKIPKNRLTKQKMMTVNDIVHSKLFLYPECRFVLMPIITKQVKELFEVCEEVELCVKILSDILNLLFRNDVGSTVNDVKEIMLTDLRTVIQTTINMNRDNPLVGNLAAIMLSIFRQMTEYHYNIYINQFSTRTDILDFLIEILLVFKDLVNKSIFPADWCEMIMLQNFVILKCLRLFSYTIRDSFSNKFDNQAWNNFFHCSIAYMTQPALQLEQFSTNKRNRILRRYKDMRLETATEIKAMWFSLGQYKVQFVPGLVESFLEMTLIPEQELRKHTLPIFFDMMQCEFYSSKNLIESFGDTKRDSSQIKGSFSDFENEMIAKLDSLIEGGKGDEQYKNLFNNIMIELCENHTSMKDPGLKFVNIITRLMERLLEYRCIINDDNIEIRMSCTVNLLDFYSEINRKEMYIRYVNKLCDLHLDCDNYTEAAYTLKLHSNLLHWSDAPLPPLLKSNRYTQCQTHRELKESLYHNIIDYFDKGKMWECALQICQELAKQYEDEIFDYESLSQLHSKMSSFYTSILKQIRPEPEYFRVAYYGKGFPGLLQNKVYIHRGKEYERLSDFCNRTLNEFPYAELMKQLSTPGEDILESPNQYILINKVDPMMDNQNRRFSGKPISDQILQYYKVNDVQKFRFSRPFHKKEPGVNENEFATLWLERTVMNTTSSLPGILRWFPVDTAYTYQISPLQNAIETMEDTNKMLKKLILAHHRDRTLNLNPLSLKLTGILDPAVMGGIMNYEKSFFIPEYLEIHPEDEILIKKLKDLIADQMPLLEFGVQVHKERAPCSLIPFQQRLEECCTEMQASVIEKYGKRVCDLKFDNAHTVTMRRQFSLIDNRALELSNVSDTNNRSRVSSLTRAQVQNFRSITASLSLITSGGNSPSVHSKQSSIGSTKHMSLASHVNNKLSSPSPNSKLKISKTPKDKRRSSKADKESLITQAIVASGTQWYTIETDIASPNGSSMPVFELRQELTPKRPLRSEVEKEKRLSRPPSGNFQNSRPPSSLVTIRGNGSSGNSSNRDSVGTTDSTASEEDNIPPPLPVKLREADYCNIPECDNVSFLYSGRVSLRIPPNKPLPPEPETEPGEELLPPTPPPKPPKT